MRKAAQLLLLDAWVVELADMLADYCPNDLGNAFPGLGCGEYRANAESSFVDAWRTTALELME